jgi:hypothetical protein
LAPWRLLPPMLLLHLLQLAAANSVWLQRMGQSPNGPVSWVDGTRLLELPSVINSAGGLKWLLTPAHRVEFGVQAGRAPTQPREALGGLHGTAGQRQIKAGVCKIKRKDLQAAGGCQYRRSCSTRKGRGQAAAPLAAMTC